VANLESALLKSIQVIQEKILTWSVRHFPLYISRAWTHWQLILTLMAQAPSRTRVCGLWRLPHSTATLSIQGVAAACMGLGSCTVSIFSCPALATLAGWAPFFLSIFIGSNPNPTRMAFIVGNTCVVCRLRTKIIENMGVNLNVLLLFNHTPIVTSIQRGGEN